ncbi:Major facilitator superfamily transporter-permease [Streptococcus sp. DD10]|nr:Major facilitator superfamily transporter-permease [Streptococcus sp. DD10]
MEKGTILLLSFMLISSFSVSSSLPEMKEFFQTYNASQVELLISVPSFGVLGMLVLTGMIERILSERKMIIAGLILVAFCGLVPVFIQDYWLIFWSRLGLGMGTGLINAKAISIISERYQGKERVQMLGLRGSAEVVGSALLTLCVGLLLTYGWRMSFIIYIFAIFILVAFLLFVPYKKRELTKGSRKERTHLTSWQTKYSLVLAVIACVIICINTAISLRLPNMVIDSGFGTAKTASLILSAMQLIGILSGFSFAPLFQQFKKNLLFIATLAFALGQLFLAISMNTWFLTLAALLAGFTYSICLTAIFNAMSGRLPAGILNKATSYVLIGCNLGGAFSPFVLRVMDWFLPSFTAIFLCFSFVLLWVAGLAFTLKSRIKGE